MGISSSFLAWLSAGFAVASALAALGSGLVGGRETKASVDKARADASVEIEAVKAGASVRIEEAKADAARANERAAALEKEAADARLQLATLYGVVGARTLSPKQRATLERELRGKTTANFVVVGDGLDNESDLYASELSGALQAAGMTPEGGPIPLSRWAPLSGPGNPITLYAPLSPDATGSNAKDPVYLALSKAIGGIALTTSVPDNGQRTRPSYYYIWVGKRSAPVLER